MAKALAYLQNDGEESWIPHANQFWMLIGFELFKTLRQHWECLEVSPQATAQTLGSTNIHKSKAEGLINQLSSVAKFTGWPESANTASLNSIGYGSFHDKLDAYSSTRMASLTLK